MKIVIFIVSIITFAASPLHAQFMGNIEVSTVEQIKEMSDDAQITAEGYITKKLGEEEYIFKDDTGEIQIEMDEDIWKNRQVDSETLIRIYGEFERDWNSMEIEVERFELL